MKYFHNENLVSCSDDQIIKIWFKKRRIKNLNVQLSINDSYPLFTLFLLYDKNILKLYLFIYLKGVFFSLTFLKYLLIF